SRRPCPGEGAATRGTLGALRGTATRETRTPRRRRTPAPCPPTGTTRSPQTSPPTRLPSSRKPERCLFHRASRRWIKTKRDRCKRGSGSRRRATSGGAERASPAAPNSAVQYFTVGHGRKEGANVKSQKKDVANEPAAGAAVPATLLLLCGFLVERPPPPVSPSCAFFPQSSYFMPLTLSVQSTTVFSPSSD
ncbi:unnamed protein product, partial [Ixodes pacificus]